MLGSSGGDCQSKPQDDMPQAGGGPDKGKVGTADSLPDGAGDIVAQFKKHFQECASQSAGTGGGKGGACTFNNMGVMPSPEHRAKSPGSCHNIGRAIDVGKVECDGKSFNPEKDHDFYVSLYECFNKKDSKFTGVYGFAKPGVEGLSQKDDHKDHLHLQYDCKYGDGQGH